MRTAVLTALLVWPVALLAEEPAAEPPAGSRAPERAPDLGLDRLLSPIPVAPAAPRDSTPGGKDRQTWEREFSTARNEVAELRARVETTQAEMRDAAGAGWSYAPGGGQAENPEMLKRKAQLKRDRQSLDAAEQRLRDLEVEASLAGVPQEWMHPSEPSSPPPAAP
jgi:hypothetical protein